MAFLSIATSIFLPLAACGGSGGDRAPAVGVGTGGAGQASPTTISTVGEHTLVFKRAGSGGSSTITTPVMNTMPSGSTIIVSVGRGDMAAFEPPTDNLNTDGYTQLGSTHAYTEWPKSGTALYAKSGNTTGPELIISNFTPVKDEITLAAVEIYGSHVEATAWNEVLLGRPVTSASVTTSGPATLVAFWWGDGYATSDQTAVPDGGFEVIQSVLEPFDLVQCAMAVKRVDAAGTYNVTWTSTPAQGAQLWLIAVAD